MRTLSAPSSAIYQGDVLHMRHGEIRHRFRYKVFSLLLDIDRLGDLDRRLKLFSLGRFNLFSFYPKDHGARDGSGLRPHAERLLREAGLGAPARILLLCYPRILGYVFNPLSVYYCFAEGGEPTALIYEVRNTYGEDHSYVVPLQNSEDGRPFVHSREKLFYVSPFISMDARYRFEITAPGETLRIVIEERSAGAPLLTAVLKGTRRHLSDRALAFCFLRYPLMTLKIIAAIHFEALRLWLKGARPFARPMAPEPRWSHAGEPDEGCHDTSRRRAA